MNWWPWHLPEIPLPSRKAVADAIAKTPKPGPGDIDWYRRRARTAEAEARKLRLALYEILGEVPGWKVEANTRDCFDAIDDIALTVLGHPTKLEAGYAEDRLRGAK